MELEEGFTTVGKSSKCSKLKQKPQGSKPKTKVHKTGCYDALEVEETSDKDDKEPDSEVKPQLKKTSTKPSVKSSKRKTVKSLADWQMKDIMWGHSKALSSSHHGSQHGSTCPVDQLPPDSFLANVLDVGKSKKKKVSPECKKKLNKKKSEKWKDKHHASLSSSESSESPSSDKDDSDYLGSSPSDDDSSGSSSSSPSSSSSDSGDESDASDSSESSNHRH